MFHVARHKNVEQEDDEEDRVTAAQWDKVTKRDKDKYMYARNGDHLMCHFECDLCIFRKLRGEDPNERRMEDRLLLESIRRVNLDAFWSRATSTVNKNRRLVEESIDLAAKVGLKGPFFDSHDTLPHDQCGYQIAILIILKTCKPGRHSEEYQQWETARAIRSAYSNWVRASGMVNNQTLTLADGDGKNYSRLADDPSGSIWLHRFAEGCPKRMGEDNRPDQAISPELLSALLVLIEKKCQKEKDPSKYFFLKVCGTYFVVCYVLSLRGPEGFLFDIAATRETLDYKQDSLVAIALWGRVKGESHERSHRFPSTNVTSSGLDVRGWVVEAISLCEKEGRCQGPMMTHLNGEIMTPKEVNETFHELLEDVWNKDLSLFPRAFQENVNLISERYSTFRSFRRGSDTRAVEMNVSKIDIEVVNRWSQKTKKNNRQKKGDMLHHYADLEMLLGPFIRYTTAM